jgi:ketosteroid isomerase-like protein
MDTTDDVRALLDSIYASIGSGDASAYLANLSEDVVGIGTDEAEYWVGRDTMAPIVEKQMAEMSGAGLWVTGGDPVIGESGDTVWAADRPTLHLPDGSSVVLRATMVATRDGDRLAVRQMHLSAPAPNEEVVQMELTTE